MDLGAAFHEYSPGRMRFIADLILPVYGVAKEASTLSVIKRKNITVPETKHADGAVYNRVVLYADDMSYACVDHGLEGQLTDRQREKFRNDFDGELETVNGIKTKMMLAREKRVKELIFNTTTWTGASLYTDNSASPWDTATTDIISQINAAKEKVRLGTGVLADSLIIGEASMQNLLKNDDVIARFPGATMITEAMIRANLAAIFGLQNLHVGAEQYREEQTKSDIFRVEESVDEKIFDSAFAHLMKIDA
jgi:hypothetical protein